MRYIFSILFFLSIMTQSFAQKVKYKDLFVLLRAENYTDADQFLRIYLTQEPDEPHANYSMGRMLQSYLDQGDLLNGSAKLKDLADSSLIYYKRGLELTTEKYVKKHDDDYYLDFRRRDMRTGKFQVKYSDIKLEIEERIVVVEEYLDNLSALLEHFTLAQKYYGQCQEFYYVLVEEKSNRNKLYFTSNTDDVDKIRQIAHVYDSSIYHLNTYRSLMKGMGKSAVNQNLIENELKQYPDSGIEETDFYSETIEYIDYRTWANSTVDIILKQIFPLKKRLISFDERVKVLHDQVVHDSIDKRDEVFQLATENVARDLRDYDTKSLPAAIYNYRIAEINYHSVVYYWLREISDTVDIGVKLDMLYDFTNQIAGVSKLVQKLHQANTPEQVELYNEYIMARYESPEGITKFISEHEKEVSEDSLQVQAWIKEAEALDRIAVWHNDSIALEEGKLLGVPENSFTTVVVDTIADRTLGFYSWHKTDDEVSLSFGVAPSNRKVDSLFQINIKKEVLNLSLTLPEYLVDTVGIGQRIWLLQSGEMSSDSTYLTQLIKTDFTVGTDWQAELQLKGQATSVHKDVESGNFVIMGEDSMELAVLDIYGQPVNPSLPDGSENEVDSEKKEDEEGNGSEDEVEKGEGGED